MTGHKTGKAFLLCGRNTFDVDLLTFHFNHLAGRLRCSWRFLGDFFLVRRARFAGFGLSGENLSVFFTLSLEHRHCPRAFGDGFSD